METPNEISQEVIYRKMSKVKLFSGRSNPELSQLIAKQLDMPLGDVKFTDYGNTEIGIEVCETVRGCHVYIIQTGCAYQGRSINDHVMELYQLINACTLSSAKSVTVLMPCYAYSRNDKKDKARISIMGSCISLHLQSLKIKRLVSMDLHSGQIQGFYQTPMDNLYCMNLFAEYFKNTTFRGLTKEQINEQFVLASADNGGVKRIEAYAKKLGMKHVLMHKHRNYDQTSAVLDSILVGGLEVVKNRTVLIIDDMMDTLGTMISAANELKNHNAKDVILVATHGIFSGPAIDRLNECDMIIKAIVTNTIPQMENLKKTKKLEVLDISGTLATVIQRLQVGECSISELFS